MYIELSECKGSSILATHRAVCYLLQGVCVCGTLLICSFEAESLTVWLSYLCLTLPQHWDYRRGHHRWLNLYLWDTPILFYLQHHIGTQNISGYGAFQTSELGVRRAHPVSSAC